MSLVIKQKVAANLVDVALLGTTRRICSINYTHTWLWSCIKPIFVANTFEVDVSILSAAINFSGVCLKIWKVSTYLPLRAYMDNLQCIYAQQGDTLLSEQYSSPYPSAIWKSQPNKFMLLVNQ